MVGGRFEGPRIPTLCSLATRSPRWDQELQESGQDATPTPRALVWPLILSTWKCKISKFSLEADKEGKRLRETSHQPRVSSRLPPGGACKEPRSAQAGRESSHCGKLKPASAECTGRSFKKGKNPHPLCDTS